MSFFLDGTNDHSTLIRKTETETDHTIIDRVEEISKKRGVSMTTVATAWCLTKKGVNPIVGLSSIERIDSAVNAVKWVKESGGLTEDEVKYLEEGYRPKVTVGY